MLSLFRRQPLFPSRALPKSFLASRIARLHLTPTKHISPPACRVVISRPRKLSPLNTAPYSVHATDVARRRHDQLGQLVPPERKVDLRQILNDLRDLELLDKLRADAGKSGTGYKDAARMLYPLLGEHASSPSTEAVWIPFSHVHAALPASYTLPWGSIQTRVLIETPPDRLAALDEEDLTCLRFMRISNVGPKFAQRFYEAGCRTFEDLKAKDDVEGSGIKLTKAQKINLALLEESEMLVPRREMERLEKELMKAVAKADSKFEGQILGSYRRGVAFSSDIDLAVRHPDFVETANAKDEAKVTKPLLGKLIEVLMKKGLISIDTQLTNGPKKWSGWVTLPSPGSIPRRIDIRLAPAHAYPYMLLGSTGDAMLMKFLRARAKNRGWCLNEYGMGDKFDAADENPNGFRAGTLKVVRDEAEIFKLLDLPPLKATEREQRVWEPKFRKAGVKLDHLHKL